MPSFSPELLLPPLTSLPDARIAWIAFSGGMDSSVLLHALVAVRTRLGFEIRALHIDHGLHPDSRSWSEHCAHRCTRYGIAFETRILSLVRGPGESLEAVARDARYKAMAQLLGPGDLLLTGQHRDDQAETLLLALMRGSGPAGLAAMPRVASLGAGRLVRPLLEYSRAELYEYASREKLDWLEDPGNRDAGFDRNFLRHRLLPLLKERWPSCTASIARSAAHCAEAQEILVSIADGELAKVAGRQPGTLSIPRLAKLSLPLRKVTLRRWFPKLGLAPPDARHLGRILSEVMNARTDANPLVAWPGCEIRRYRDQLFAMPPLPPLPGALTLHWDYGLLSLPSGLGRLELVAVDGQGLDPSKLFAGGLEIRFRVAGLSCRHAPGGHRRSLKKRFQEAGIPPWIRPYVPLIFAGPDLVAVGDIWVCQPDKQVWAKELRIYWRCDLPGISPASCLPVHLQDY